MHDSSKKDLEDHLRWPHLQCRQAGEELDEEMAGDDSPWTPRCQKRDCSLVPSFPWIFVHSLQQAGQQVGPVAGYLAGLRWAARPPMGRTGEGGHTGSGQGCRQAPGPLGYRSTLAQPYPAPRPRGGPPTLAQPREPTGGPGTGGLGRVGGGRPQGSWLSQRGAGVSRPEACRRAIRERQP